MTRAITNVRTTTPTTTSRARASRRIRYRVTVPSGGHAVDWRSYTNTTFGYAGLSTNPWTEESIARW